VSEIHLPNMPDQPAGLLADARMQQVAALHRNGLASGPAASRQLERAAKGFETVLLNRLLEDMGRTIPKSGLLDSSISKQVQGLFWFYLAQDLGNKGGLGMWKEIQEQLSRYGQPGQRSDRPKVEHTS